MNRWLLTALTILFAPGIALAQRSGGSAPTSVFSQAAIAVAARAEVASASQTPTPQQARTNSPWIKRHPVMFGAILGAGVGAVIGAATLPEDRNPDYQAPQAALEGSVVFAGIGALGGWIISAATK